MGAIEKGVQLYRETKNVIDAVNQQGYEWFGHFLRHPKSTWHYYRDRYDGKHPAWRLFGAVMWRLPLMIIPVLPALYILNRVVGVILNPWAWKNNFTKPLTMLGMLGLGALTFALPYVQFIAKPHFIESARLINHVLPFVVSKALQAPMAVGLLVWGSLLVGSALLYAGKHVAHFINQLTVGTSTRKHHIDNPKKMGQLVLPPVLMKAYKEVRTQNQILKNKLKEDPSSIDYIPVTPGTASWINHRATSNNIEAAEATLETSQEFLGRCEKIMKAQKKEEPVDQNEANDLIVEQTGHTTTTLYRQWCSAMAVVHSKYKADPEVSRLAYEDHKIIERSKLTA